MWLTDASIHDVKSQKENDHIQITKSMLLFRHVLFMFCVMVLDKNNSSKKYIAEQIIHMKKKSPTV